MELEQLRSKLAAFLAEGGVQALVSWPRERRAGLSGPVVLVSLEELRCGPAGLQDYLGMGLNQVTGQWEELYGRKAELTFGLDILAPSQAGAEACREAFVKMVSQLQTGRPGGLTVRKLTGGETQYDSKEGLLKMHAQLECEGWLYASGGGAGTFLDFTLRGDVKA